MSSYHDLVVALYTRLIETFGLSMTALDIHSYDKVIVNVTETLSVLTLEHHKYSEGKDGSYVKKTLSYDKTLLYIFTRISFDCPDAVMKNIFAKFAERQHPTANIVSADVNRYCLIFSTKDWTTNIIMEPVFLNKDGSQIFLDLLDLPPNILTREFNSVGRDLYCI